MRLSRLIIPCMMLALSLAGKPGAFAEPAAPRAQPPAESHQFDFWIGEWTVTTPAGEQVGHSRIERIAGGFGLLENWTGAGGASGRSLNAWNPGEKQWQQFWIGSEGEVLALAGGRNAQGQMVLAGERVNDEGVSSERISWTPDEDGSVRQVWERSSDGGKTWRVVFDGRYVKKPEEHSLGGSAGRIRRFYSLQ